MFRILSTETLHPGSYDIDATPLAFELPVGSSIVAYSGTIWLTQEGLLDDVVLSTGSRFTVRSTRRLVISSWRGPAKIQIVAPAATAGELIGIAREHAKQLRAEAIESSIASARDALWRVVATGAAALRHAFEPARRAAGH